MKLAVVVSVVVIVLGLVAAGLGKSHLWRIRDDVRRLNYEARIHRDLNRVARA